MVSERYVWVVGMNCWQVKTSALTQNEVRSFLFRQGNRVNTTVFLVILCRKPILHYWTILLSLFHSILVIHCTVKFHSSTLKVIKIKQILTEARNDSLSFEPARPLSFFFIIKFFVVAICIQYHEHALVSSQISFSVSPIDVK